MVGFGFALFFLPETHGKKLSDIQAFFDGSNKKKKKKVNNKTTAPVVLGRNQSSYSKKPNLETVAESEKMITQIEIEPPEKLHTVE